MMPGAKKRTASITEFQNSIMSFVGFDPSDTEIIIPEKKDSDLNPTIERQSDETIITSNQGESIDAHSTFDDVLVQMTFIDMGLSVKWADMNLGADSITDLGQPYKGVVLEDPNEWDAVPEQFGGTPYDPVTCIKEHPFRLPKRSEWRELIDKCEWKLTEKDGVKGYLVVAKNGNSIFLPFAAGYWSSTKGESKDFPCVYYLFLNSYDIDMVYNVYDILRCIRPVQENKD